MCLVSPSWGQPQALASQLLFLHRSDHQQLLPFPFPFPQTRGMDGWRQDEESPQRGQQRSSSIPLGIFPPSPFSSCSNPGRVCLVGGCKK